MPAEDRVKHCQNVMEQTWLWKDDVHLEKRLYYGKIIRGQPSFIAPEFLPDFVAGLGGAA